MNHTVTNNEEAKQFEMEVEGHKALERYAISGNVISLLHTEVDKELEGKGIASYLAKFVLDYARINHYKVIPVCPYIRTFIERHPEYKDITMHYNIK